MSENKGSGLPHDRKNSVINGIACRRDTPPNPGIPIPVHESTISDYNNAVEVLMRDLKEFVRRNEDRELDEEEKVKEEEIMAEDRARMHTGMSGIIGSVLRALIWIAIIFVVIKVIGGLGS